MNEQVEKILDYVTAEENKYYEISSKEMEKRNIGGMIAMQMHAAMFQKVRYFIEIMLEGEQNE